ncbi:Protein SAWADEE [Hibiscus syriacus]|uniref:Protein SAWADEE n=1 Tax=Hibiscus syriacus TaxID=106335 RepID=A0A6A3AT03_HIBSY|nr:Protein SAWADEE [Hibiscus syriacus]
MEFEAKSSRDGAWYDVATFVAHRYLDTGDPEVKVRITGFGPEEDEWVNIRKHEGKEQALYFDAHVLDAQRRRHDIRGCRCRFLVRYDHDQSEEIVPLKKICRRLETDYRLQQLHAAAAQHTNQESKIPGTMTTNVTDPGFSVIENAVAATAISTGIGQNNAQNTQAAKL